MDATDNTPEGVGAAMPGNPPRENIVRSAPGVELTRDADGGMPTLRGHFSVFDTWTTISSQWEGTFRERIAPGAFAKTISENRNNIKVLFQHGRDPQVGDKPLGAISELREDETGAYYEVPLLDTSYNRDLLPGLEAGLYGASFRFKVMREDFDKKPDRSEDNPDGIPERTVREVALHEFGPVTFGAYPEATAGVRSLTDEYIVASLFGDPERLTTFLTTTFAPSTEQAPAEATPAPERRDDRVNRFKTDEEWFEWLSSR